MTGILGPSLLNLAATFVSLTAGFLVSVITARLLGPAGSGTVAYAMWLVMCASAVADRGLPQTVLRYVAALGPPDGSAWRALVRNAFSTFLPAVALVFLLFLAYGLYHYAAGRADPWLWIATALLFLTYAFSAFSTAVARGRRLFRQAAATTAVGSLLQVPLVFLGALLLGPAGALFAMLTRYLPQALHLRDHVDRRLPAAPGSLTPEMRSYGRNLWTSDMVDVVLLSRVEYLVIGYCLSQADLGFFAAAVVFAGLVSQLTLQLSPAFLVGLAARAPGGAGAGEQPGLYRKSARLTALFVMPLGVGGAAIVSPLVPIVFGGAFTPAADAAALFLLASVPAGLAVVPWAYLAAREEGRSLMRLNLASAAMTLALLVAVVPAYGVFGAAVVRCLAELLTLGLLLWTVRAKEGPGLPVNALARTLAAAGLSGMAAFAVARALPSLSGILLAVATGAVVFGAATRLLGLVCPAEAERLAAMAGNYLPDRLRPLARRLVGLIAAPRLEGG